MYAQLWYIRKRGDLVPWYAIRDVFFFFFILLSNRAMKREKFLSKRHTFDRNNIYHDVFIISYL